MSVPLMKKTPTFEIDRKDLENLLEFGGRIIDPKGRYILVVKE